MGLCGWHTAQHSVSRMSRSHGLSNNTQTHTQSNKPVEPKSSGNCGPPSRQAIFLVRHSPQPHRATCNLFGLQTHSLCSPVSKKALEAAYAQRGCRQRRCLWMSVPVPSLQFSFTLPTPYTSLPLIPLLDLSVCMIPTRNIADYPTGSSSGAGSLSWIFSVRRYGQDEQTPAFRKVKEGQKDRKERATNADPCFPMGKAQPGNSTEPAIVEGRIHGIYWVLGQCCSNNCIAKDEMKR